MAQNPRKILLFAALVFFNLAMAGDFTIIIKQVNPFQFGQRQIFTPVTLINNSGNKQEVYIKVSVKSGYTNEVIADFQSTAFTVAPGSMDLAAASPALASSDYYDAKYREYEQRNATFPSGDYQYCISIMSPGNVVLDQSCEKFQMQALNPAVLITPEDESVHAYKGVIQFNWTPCTPHRAQIYYVFKLAEILDGQSKTEAISRNPALHSIGGLASGTYTYPLNAPRLEKGKKYAWQIECYEDLSKPEFKRDKHRAVSSEVFEFSIIGEEKIDSLLFSKPKRFQDASYATLNEGKLYFTFESDYLQGKLNYSFLDHKRKEIPVEIRRIDESGILTDAPLVLIGPNKYELTLKGTPPPDGIYTLELSDLKGVVYYLNIKIQSNKPKQ